LLALIYTDFFGVTAMGATRWIRIGPLNIQPSEIAKLSTVLALAHYFHNVSAVNIRRMSFIIPPLIMLFLPFALVVKQPDLGTSLIILMVGGAMFFAAGVQIWKFVVLFISGIISMPFAWLYLHDYQKKRVLAFLSPESDPLGDGYNILQSKIAIGSGGLTGKGFLKGTQSQLSFLPEKQTDFIFTMLAEEFGFIGSVVVIILYAIILMYGVWIAINSKNHFGRMMAIGITTILFVHVFVNIAMVMGLIPVVGAPLPLLSYGGTIMMTMLIAFGFLLNADLYSEEVFDKNVN
jgi:rod shape determining protein RodA